MSRVTDRDDWFDLWDADKKSMIDTMAKNMAADLAAGYSFLGNAIQRQVAEIEAYKKQYEEELMFFAAMEEKDVNRWCFYDMKRRGAIE